MIRSMMRPMRSMNFTVLFIAALVASPIWADSKAPKESIKTTTTTTTVTTTKETTKGGQASNTKEVKTVTTKDGKASITTKADQTSATTKEGQATANTTANMKDGQAATTETKTDTKNPRAELAAKNLDATNKFLEENKKKSGIVTTPSGLQYKIVKEGKGKVPGPTSFVTVNYKGSLIDGTVFDSSAQGPVTFAVNAVIPGWTEALQKMKEGSKWIVYVPPQLAYGEKGIGRIIGPNQLLVFEIELVDTDEGLTEDFKEKKVEAWEDPANAD